MKIILTNFQKILKLFSTYSFNPYKGKKNFRYLTPRELYGHNSLKIKRGRCDVDKCKDQMIGANGFKANAPLTGFLDCQIRHSASNYQGWFLKTFSTKRTIRHISCLAMISNLSSAVSLLCALQFPVFLSCDIMYY